VSSTDLPPDRAEALWSERCAALAAVLGRFERLAVAFSGGVDSSVLLAAARAVLGEGAFGVIADSPSLARRELALARATAAAIGAPLVVVATDELADPEYRANAGQRCYHCKRALFDAMQVWARGAGVRDLAFGEIADDLREERPGRRAAREARVHAPLVEAGFSKEDVRRLAREHGLTVAEKPASACLASRLPIGTEVTRARLERVERAEDALRDLGFEVLRVRDLGVRARLEVGRSELERAHVLADAIAMALAHAGFEGYALETYVPPLERAGLRLP
jgi:pyridinium-3,5-biscarboxylic acid mononucleotide sulfurtransferase